jgi:hypothetical protein
MKPFKLGILAASALSLVAMSAHAATKEGTWTMSMAKKTNVAGALQETFESGDSLDLNLTKFSTFKPEVVIGKAIEINPQPDGSFTYACMKTGMVSHYLCQRGGTTLKPPGPGSVDISFQDSVYFGFRWGTIDWNNKSTAMRWNEVRLYNGNTLLTTVTGMQARPKLQQVAQAAGIATPVENGFFIWNAGTLPVNRVVFWSTVDSFELDNIAIKPGSVSGAAIAPAAAVPEPSTYVMLAAGLGLVGWVARRRRRA